MYLCNPTVNGKTFDGIVTPLLEFLSIKIEAIELKNVSINSVLNSDPETVSHFNICFQLCYLNNLHVVVIVDGFHKSFNH